MNVIPRLTSPPPKPNPDVAHSTGLLPKAMVLKDKDMGWKLWADMAAMGMGTRHRMGAYDGATGSCSTPHNRDTRYRVRGVRGQDIGIYMLQPQALDACLQLSALSRRLHVRVLGTVCVVP